MKDSEYADVIARIRLDFDFTSEVLECLTERKKKILNLIYCKVKSGLDATGKLNISQSYVSKLKNEALEELSAALESYNKKKDSDDVMSVFREVVKPEEEPQEEVVEEKKCCGSGSCGDDELFIIKYTDGKVELLEDSEAVMIKLVQLLRERDDIAYSFPVEKKI